MNKKIICFIRNGQSTWSYDHRVVGWHDCNLSPKGIFQSKKAGKILLKNDIKFDIVYTSVLRRSIKSYNYLSENLDSMYIPHIKTWRLNGKHYGALTGYNKFDLIDKFGEEKVDYWINNFNAKPPNLPSLPPGDCDIDNILKELKEFGINKYLKHPKFYNKYKNIFLKCLPVSESIEEVFLRTKTLWEENISFDLKENKNVWVIGHNHSLKGIINNIENINTNELLNLKIDNGQPIIYELDDKLFKKRRYFLK